MADFDLTVASGATLQQWLDPERTSDGMPSRLNPQQGYPHKRWVGTVGQPITVNARLRAGTLAPLDAALGGLLFVAWMAEYPGALPGIVGTTGQSSVQTFTPPAPGHYLLGMRRPQHGICLIHIDAEH